ncbi:MAG TPA: molybdopterin-synthase adenylyltransferase MoeB [Myxococcota bacterium]|jgi:molybdopterin/thiamine biosynthesis adenylyltransferase/rhodanese-related sulfurtransferase|nr:molybdopterin-synthase adenylyltransferase MoeB [Myxococcota bacterium]
MPTFQDLLAAAKREIREITPAEAAPLAKGAAAAFVDVREPDEYQKGYIPGAKWIPRGYLELKIEGAVPDKKAPVVVYCAAGTRSAFAARTLQDLGYADVRSMSGGFNKWQKDGLPVEKPFHMTAEQVERYSRHTILPEVGEAGQAKLLQSKVLLIGAGGLGSPAALYLAAAGVGTLGLVDDDVVDASNLQRQVLHATDRVGMPKVDSAEKTIRGLNPDVKVVKYQTRLTAANVEQIFPGYDVIVDGADNFPTRYLVNDACVKFDIPNVHGSIFRFDGQATVFHPHVGPCYRCLYPEPPPPGMAPSCAEGGVLGILPGIIGVVQANETVKLILKIGETLAGRLLMYDALNMTFRFLKLRRDPRCAVCGDDARPQDIKLFDYEGFCALPRGGDAAQPAA